MSAIPKLIVHVEMRNGVVHEDVRITGADRIAYEREARKHKDWPGMVDGQSESAIHWAAWHALKRTGRYGGTWEAFEQGDYIDVIADPGDDEDEGEGGAVDPTPRAAATD